VFIVASDTAEFRKSSNTKGLQSSRANGVEDGVFESVWRATAAFEAIGATTPRCPQSVAEHLSKWEEIYGEIVARKEVTG
jgi:hypothetical protein